MPPEVRSLTVADAPAYRAMMLEAYTQHPKAFGSSTAERAAQPLTWWERRVEGGDGLVLGAFEGEVLAGVVGVSFDRREKMRHKSRLYGMYVRTDRRGRGVAAALVGEALRRASRHPECRVMQLTVVEDNGKARALYERFGFEAYGVEPFAMRVGDTFHRQVHLWRPIRPEEK